MAELQFSVVIELDKTAADRFALLVEALDKLMGEVFDKLEDGASIT